MAYLRLLRGSDLRTIQNSYVELFQLQAPSRRALEDALASKRWLSLAAVSPDTSSPSRQEYMGGFVMSVVATVADFHTDMNYYSNGGGLSAADGGGGGAGVGVQASGLETIRLPLEEKAVNICVLGVLPSYRRRGLARLMLRQVVDSARTASACAVFLHVRPSNTAALALYQSAGFVAAALLPAYYDNEDAPASSDGSSGSSSRSSRDKSGYDAGRAAADGAPAEGPRTAGGDAVLLVLPLTEEAAAAVAAAAVASRDAVQAAVTEARNDAAGATAISVPGGDAVRNAARSGGDIQEAARPAAAIGVDTPQSGNRFVGRGLPNEPVTASLSQSRVNTTSGSATTTTATTTSTRGAGDPPVNGRDGSAEGPGGLLGILAAAAAGVADGLSGLLP
ncbi:hypothetical protein Vretimale_12707, partial [Volvox reticuliferus]